MALEPKLISFSCSDQPRRRCYAYQKAVCSVTGFLPANFGAKTTHHGQPTCWSFAMHILDVIAITKACAVVKSCLAQQADQVPYTTRARSDLQADHKLRGYTPPEFQAADRKNSTKADSVEGVYLWCMSTAWSGLHRTYNYVYCFLGQPGKYPANLTSYPILSNLHMSWAELVATPFTCCPVLHNQLVYPGNLCASDLPKLLCHNPPAIACKCRLCRHTMT